MLTFSLQSGSNGNCIFIEAGDVRLLIDAGISGRCAEQRMRVHGRDIRQVDAVLVSHDHVDHLRGAGVFQRKYQLPVYLTRRTYGAVAGSLGPMKDVRHFVAGQPLWIRGVTIHTIPTPHDAADGVAFIIEHDGRRLGVLTDLGHPFDALHRLLPSLHAVYLESNYDPVMLKNGPYPWHLQERIRGPHGHLSNQESADLLHAAGQHLRWAAMAHLSEKNNHPDVALRTHRKTLGRGFPLVFASRYQVSDVMEV